MPKVKGEGIFQKHPEWLKVEKVMTKYMLKQLNIYHLQNELQEMMASGIRTTPSFYGPDSESDNRMEGSRGGPMRIEVMDYIETVELMKERIIIAQQYRSNLEMIVFKTFEDQHDKLKFVRLFFWSHYTNRGLTVRKLHVIKHMPFLQARERKTRKRIPDQAGSLFYHWRDEIYDTLAEAMGYKTEEE